MWAPNKLSRKVQLLKICDSDMGLVSKRKRLHQNPVEWAEKQYARGKFVMSAIALLWFMNLVYYDVNKIKIAAELVRIVGLGCLVHKIGTEESCGGEHHTRDY